MATDDALSAFLAQTDASDRPLVSLQPGDISRMSIESFVASAAGTARELASSGDLRLHGDGVVGSTADLAHVGLIATTWQKLVASVGAALEQVKSNRGQLPSDIVRRTTLALNASPSPGSVVLHITPKSSPFVEVAPDGRMPMLDIPRPLADRASEALIDLLGSATSATPASLEALSSTMLELGPRVGSSLLALAQTLEKSEITLDAAWREPEQPTRTAQVTPSSARWIQEFVAGRDLDAEEEVLVGVLRTISDAERWLVEVDESLRRMDATELEPSVISALHVGQRVELVVRTAFREQPDGRTRRTHRILRVGSAAPPTYTGELPQD